MQGEPFQDQEIEMDIGKCTLRGDSERARATVARFVLENWVIVDVGKTLKFNDANTEPRLKQLAIPISIVLQLMPDSEERFRNYILRRQEEVTKTRSESWEGTYFNYVYSLAIGEEKPVEDFERYLVEGKVVAVTASTVAKKFNSSARSVIQALSSIGIMTELKTVTIHDNDGNPKGKKTRMHVVRMGPFGGKSLNVTLIKALNLMRHLIMILNARRC